MVKKITEYRFEVWYNHAKRRSQSIEAGKQLSSLQELMENCDVVLTMLSNGTVGSFEGPSGL
jgi:3-hydroxyisobutyrate dehydrogenase-like beta-hydroxyacid dehydrogenase